MSSNTMSRRDMLYRLGFGAAGTLAVAATDGRLLDVVASAAAQNGPLAIEYWHRSEGTAGEAFTKLADQFNAQFGDRVTVTTIFQGGIQELNQKVRAAALGGELPGALMGDDYDITQYVANSILVPLDQYITDPANGLTQAQLADFLPEQINRHKLAIYQNQTMAFPQAFSAFTCWWNVDALRTAGFDAPPATWAEFPDMARAIAQANPGMAAWIFTSAGDRFISIMKTYGVEWLKEGGAESNFDAPEVLEIMTWLKQLNSEGLVAVTTEDAVQLFAARQSAFFMDSSANVEELSQITDFAWDGTMPPQGTSGATLHTETYGPVNCIPATTPEKQLAGWLWLKWLTTPEAYATWIPATSYFPAVTSAVTNPALADFYARYPVAAKLYQQVAPNASILSPSPALTEVRGQITANVVNEVLLGRLSPEEGVKKLKAEADQAITRAQGA